MSVTSPLDSTELRQIEKTLDEGHTQEAATLLGELGDPRDHKDAIDFLTTRLLFQRGRIDSDGAADRVGAILDRVHYFPEAEDWLFELEARTERTERSALAEGEKQPALSATASTTPPPASHAPSIPRDGEQLHPYFDELGEDDDDVTPTESSGAKPERGAEPRPDSSEPPARPNSLPADLGGWEPPTRPDAARSKARATHPAPRPDVRPKVASFEPPTRPDIMRAELAAPETPTRPSYMPFDNLRAKERLSVEAGRYKGDITDPGESMGGPRKARSVRAARTSSRAPLDPERRILEAFQYVKDGLLDEARKLLADEASPVNLRPEIRTIFARLLLELGHAERAAGEAVLALEQAPQSAEARLVFVWSAVRYARQRDDAWSLERAGRILKDLQQTPTFDVGLLDALTACIEARVGVAAVALRLAQRALRNSADSVDGLAALAEAAALTGEERRAEAALERLFAISEEVAEQIAPRLRRLGVGEHGPTSSASVWLPLEHTLSSGAREVALAGLEDLATDALAELGGAVLDDAEHSARGAARFFTLAPLLRHFGPYDLSLHSIERLDVGLGLAYGSGPRAADVDGASRSLWQLAGVYLGEVLQRSCDGQWQAAPERLEDTIMDVLGIEVRPFQAVRHRISHGRHATLKAALGEVIDRAPPEAHGFRVAMELAPPAPWGEQAWPTLNELPRLGRALGHSVVAVFAADLDQHRLDRSGESLRALDRYLELVAPVDTPSRDDAPWTRWLCVFLGAYLGEVLCKELGGVWAAAERPDAESFVVQLGDRHEAPLALLLDALTGRHPISLADYLGQLRQTLGPA